MRVLLDTNVYSAMRRGSEPVAACIRRAEQVLMSTVVIGELLHGFRAGARYAENLAELQEFLDQPWVEVVEVGLITADRFARVATALRRKGTPIPTNDVWIAAHTMETGAELLSLDRHFERVDGLVWASPK